MVSVPRNGSSDLNITGGLKMSDMAEAGDRRRDIYGQGYNIRASERARDASSKKHCLSKVPLFIVP